jgi:tetratricopeptide (TPR) repeat protein
MVGFTAYTSSNGTFALYNIPAGRYEVVAHRGRAYLRENVYVGLMESTVDLRFAEPAGSSSENASSVSVAQMKVPGKARNAFEKAREAFANNKFDEAEKQVGKALGIYPHFAEAITLQGLLFLQKNDLAQSQREFESAIQWDPNYSMAYLALGTVMNSHGHYDDATRTLERSISISPDLWQGYFEMAKSYLGKGMYDKALQVANKAQTLAPSNFATIHLLKAYALLPQKLYKDAVQELQAFLSRSPKGPSAEQAQQLLAKAQAAETASERSGQ